METFFQLLIAHAFADYYLQSNQMLLEKDTAKGLLKHVIIYSVVIGFVVIINNKNLASYSIISIFIVFLSHYLIDYFKIRLEQKYPNQSLSFFVLDQFVHIIILWKLWHFSFINTGFVLFNDYLIHIMVLVYLLKPTSVLINKIMVNTYPNESQNWMESKKYDEGQLIGYLERAIILMLYMSDQLGVISILIAAKTLVRYGQFQFDKKQNEGQLTPNKYLIGTLLSFLFGLIGIVIISLYK